MVLLGGFLKLEMVWVIADKVKVLMALPNLIALLALSPVVVSETKLYMDNLKSLNKSQNQHVI